MTPRFILGAARCRRRIKTEIEGDLLPLESERRIMLHCPDDAGVLTSDTLRRLTQSGEKGARREMAALRTRAQAYWGKGEEWN